MRGMRTIDSIVSANCFHSRHYVNEMMLNRRDNGEDGKTESTQGRPDSSYSLQR